MSSEFVPNPTTRASATGRLNAAGIASTGAPAARAPAVEIDVADVPLQVRDHVRWGPIVAGVVGAFAVLLFLTVLGIALGVSTLGGDDPAAWGTAAGIWGGLSLLVAFFIGGWLASRSATTVAEGDGLLNGFIVGAATLLLLLWMTTTAVTGVLGFFATTVADIAGAAGPVAIEAIDQAAAPTASEAERAVNQAVENPEAAVPPEADQAARAAAQAAGENAGPGAWGTAIAIVLAIAAAMIGGMVGQNQQFAFPGARTVIARR
jgi:hypothetical protein